MNTDITIKSEPTDLTRPEAITRTPGKIEFPRTMAPPWDRLKTEPADLYQLFKGYLEIGKTRTNDNAWDLYKAQRETEGETLNGNRPNRHFLSKIAAWKWRERAAMWDFWTTLRERIELPEPQRPDAGQGNHVEPSPVASQTPIERGELKRGITTFLEKMTRHFHETANTAYSEYEVLKRFREAWEYSNQNTTHLTHAFEAAFNGVTPQA